MRLSKKKRRSNLAVGFERMRASVSVPASMQPVNIDFPLSSPISVAHTSADTGQRPSLRECDIQASRSQATVTTTLDMPLEVNHFEDSMRSPTPAVEHVSPSMGQSDDAWKYFHCELCKKPVRGGQACHCPGAMAKYGFVRP